jgi:UDP-N-acetylmuramoylalanine--D-glutamate ligase
MARTAHYCAFLDYYVCARVDWARDIEVTLMMEKEMGLQVIVGLGVTGLSCARYCLRKGLEFALTDSRKNPPALAELKRIAPDAEIVLGELSSHLIARASRLLVSPGVSPKEPAILAAKKRGVPCVGDIELFFEAVDVPVIAITGANGKTTIAEMLGSMAKKAKQRAVVAGNIGHPVLDCLAEKRTPDLYILELSSFQLETTDSLKTQAATILNISEDHMDRYATLKEYTAAKQKIYTNTALAIFNRRDALTKPKTKVDRCVSFGLDAPPGPDDFGIIDFGDTPYLAKGCERLLAIEKLQLQGKHHFENALAALALGSAAGFPMDAMFEALRHFKGVSHRCQFLRRLQGVYWYNDSKGTNVGATAAALDTLGKRCRGKIVLIAGGRGKGADFMPLKPLVKRYVRHLILMGEVAEQMAGIFQDKVSVTFVQTMKDAVLQADLKANRHDIVVLSPACSSFDMFDNFEQRGEIFSRLVKDL